MNSFICSDIQEQLSHVCFFAQTVILDRKFRSFLIFPKWKFAVVYCLNAFLVRVHSFFYQLSYEFEKFVDIMYIRKYKMKNTACPIPMHNLNSAPWFLKFHFSFSCNKLWIHLLSGSSILRLFKCLCISSIIPGTLAIVSKKITLSS